MADLYLVNAEDIAFTPANPLQQKKLARDQNDFSEKQKALESKKQLQSQRAKELKDRLQKYDAQYKAELDEIEKQKLVCAKNGCFYKPSEPKVMLVVRIKGVNKLCPRVRKVFQLFRLFQIHNAVFIKINKATMEMLKHIQPFVAYGYPSVDTIRKLVYKRGYVRCGPNGRYSRIAITDNSIIEQKLGSFGVQGVEDIVNTIYTVGPNFKEVNNFLWTFKLRPPRGGFICKRHGFAEFRKGDWGNREEYINELVDRMI